MQIEEDMCTVLRLAVCAGTQFTGVGSEVEGAGSETRLDPAERKP